MRKGYVFVLAAAVLAAGCRPAKEVKAPEKIPVRVEKVVFSQIDESVEYVGDIKGQDEAKVYPKVSGKVVEKTRAEGETVMKGNPILFLDRDEVGMKFEKAPVESPLDGVVGAVYVDIGTNVSPASAVALVVNIDKVKILLDLPEKYLPRVSLGQQAKVGVDAYPQESFAGAVTKIRPVVNLDNRAAPIEITVDNSKHLLKPGMFARVSLILATHTGVPVVMQEAVLGRNHERSVYVVEGNKAVVRRVVLGVRDGPMLEIKEGLKEGDLVVVVGQQRLFENADVSVEQASE